MKYDEIQLYESLSSEIGDHGAKAVVQLLQYNVTNMKSELATKEDIIALKVAYREDLQGLRTETRQEITALRLTHMKEMNEVRVTLTDNISRLRSQVVKSVYVTGFTQFIAVAATVIALIRIFFR